MRVVLRRTGLTADALRAWEKRYGAVNPHRSSGGQRLYSDDDIERLVLLRRVTAAGQSIGQVARLPIHALRSLLTEDGSAPGSPASVDEESAASDLLSEVMTLANALDGPGIEAALRRGVLLLGADALVERVMLPLLREIEDSTRLSELPRVGRHIASSAAQRVTHWIGEILAGAADAPCIALAAIAAEPHDLGIQIVRAVASVHGWRVVDLGSDLPAESIADATRRTGAKVLTLCVTSADAARNAGDSLRTIRDDLSHGVAVIAFGDGMEEVAGELDARGIGVVPGLDALRTFLHSFR